MKNLLTIFAVVMTCLTACDKPDVTEPDDKQEQTGNSGNENEGGNENEDGNGNENGETPSEGEGEGETEKVKSMTITLEKLTASEAYFKASTKKTAPDIEIGIYYSQYAGDHIYDCERVWDYDLENGECELVIEDLDANTTYYYRPYLFIDGTRELGDELSFTTADYSITVDVAVNGSDVTFSGYIDVGTDRGILYSTEPQLSVSHSLVSLNSFIGEYSYTLTDLSENTTYYYCTYYWSYERDAPVYGDVGSFTTGNDRYRHENKDLSLSSAIDLSSSGTANCYIVSKAGLYKIKAVKGNDESQAITDASTSVILWETFGTDIKPDKLDLIKEFCYKDGYIVFRTANAYKEGNAVIAVKDAEGNILWSWHIWLTDQPMEHIYKNNAGTMMDRNLGATSATPGDVGALGLLYQWGRKDPFLGTSSILDEYDEADSTIEWPSPVISDASVGTIDYVTSHPTTFVYAGVEYHVPNDWHYSQDNTLWTTSERAKSIYDPCPTGWRVPDCGVWEKAGFDDTTYDSIDVGISFSISSPSATWYPVSGVRASYVYGGGLGSAGDISRYWSCSPYEGKYYEDKYYKAYCLSLQKGGYVAPSSHGRAHGYSVRCLKE